MPTKMRITDATKIGFSIVFIDGVSRITFRTSYTLTLGQSQSLTFSYVISIWIC